MAQSRIIANYSNTCNWLISFEGFLGESFRYLGKLGQVWLLGQILPNFVRREPNLLVLVHAKNLAKTC